MNPSVPIMPKSYACNKNMPPPLKNLIAVVGCDGTGKSTLTADLLVQLSPVRPVQRRYLGLVSGEMGERIKHLPLIGVRLERHLAAKAQRAQDMKKQLPGSGTALVMYFLSLWRLWHLRKAMALSQRGVLVIADRYPQCEIAGFHYDGPGLSANRSAHRLVRWLAAREQKLYEWMAAQRPSLVIRLNIDAKTAHERKPDHSFEELKDKISVMPRLSFNGANIVEIDASEPYAQVLETVLQAIRTTLQLQN